MLLIKVVKEYNKKGLLFPRRIRCGINKGDVHSGTLTHSRVLQILHNPKGIVQLMFLEEEKINIILKQKK